jgi:hypothetical protein
MMLDQTHPDTLKAQFQQSVDALDRALRKFQLMKLIQQREEAAADTSHEERSRILAEIEVYHQEIKQIDQIEQTGEYDLEIIESR